MWSSLFLATIWAIWKKRNRRSFDEKCVPTAKIAMRVKIFVASWVTTSPIFRGLPMDVISKMEGSGFLLALA